MVGHGEPLGCNLPTSAQKFTNFPWPDVEDLRVKAAEHWANRNWHCCSNESQSIPGVEAEWTLEATEPWVLTSGTPANESGTKHQQCNYEPWEHVERQKRN